ncbi:MAG: heavy metal translocating P-type ATPase [Phycisphaerae bacterium]
MTSPATTCDFCHLPMALRRAPAGDDAPRYCCYGCRFAAAVTHARGEAGQATWMLTRLGLALFLAMAVMVFSLYLYGREVYAQHDAVVTPLDASLTDLMRYLSLVSATPVFFILGVPILANAIAHLRRGVASTDALVILGVAGALISSYVATWRGAGSTYYDTACMILVLITLGRYLEAAGKLRASAAVEALEKLLPDDVTADRDGQRLTLSPRSLRTGDLLCVQAGQRIAADGVIESGRAHVDEQLITGESTPVVRDTHDIVHAGTLNLDGVLTVRVNRTGSDAALGRMVALLELAKRSKGRYERLGDRVATVFVPVVVALAAAALAMNLDRGIGEAVMSALAVMLIACPCALGIATPTAIWVALGRAARRGVFFRNGETIESLARVRVVCFDKTGTLTTGEAAVASYWADAEATAPEHESQGAAARLVTGAIPGSHGAAAASGDGGAAGHGDGGAVTRANGDGVAGAHGDAGAGVRSNLSEPISSDASVRAVLAVAAGLAASSTHALARGVATFARRQHVAPAPVDAVRIIPGRGVGGRYRGAPVALGNVAMMEEATTLSGPAREALRSALAGGRPITCLAWGGAVRGVFAFDERIRDGAKDAIDRLRDWGCVVCVLTGDHERRGAAVADALATPSRDDRVDVYADLSPERKIGRIDALRRAEGPVAMVGDGLNDAAALLAADVGIAMGCGADVARESADVCLIGDDLTALPAMFALARRTVRTIKQNLVWAFAYNVLGIGVAITGNLSPVLAAGAMVASSLLVLANAHRLSRGP